jgi:hypothetical protein
VGSNHWLLDFQSNTLPLSYLSDLSGEDIKVKVCNKWRITGQLTE